MKLWFGAMVFLWLMCGLIGAWMLGDLDARHWKKIVRGPMTLAQGFNENPVRYPDRA